MKTIRDLAAERGVSMRAVERERAVRRYGAPALIDALERGQLSLACAETLCLLPHDQQADLVSSGASACLAHAVRMRRRAEWRRVRDLVLDIVDKHRGADLGDDKQRRTLAKHIAASIVVGGGE